ncbi:MAG: hypothetical protein L3J34_02695 [Flavobacteriaceae bacterium]|nr:hypothetical protein [Flavobacteriaceae bacterium]
MKHLNKLTLIFCLIFSSFIFSQETVAILPFTFSDDGQISVQKGKQVQQYIIDYINKKSKHFNITTLNGRNISVALNKAGITPETIDNFTTNEISEAIGGADYILMGSVDRSFVGMNNLETDFGTINNKSKKKTNVYGGSAGSTTKKYNADVYISIFRANGKVVYEKSKGNIFIDDTPDSWKNTVMWHVRHFPFYH